MDLKGGTVSFLFSTLLYRIFLLKENILKNLTIGIWLFCLITVFIREDRSWACIFVLLPNNFEPDDRFQ